MQTKHKKILLLGSYNGHDSLGDECLLESVITQFNRVFDQPEFVLHAHTPDTAFSKNLVDTYSFKANQGLQTLFWWWRTKWRHLRTPMVVFGTFAAITFPFYLLASLFIHGSRGSLAVRQIARADLVFIFGGTNFSRQWFWLNAPYYMATSLLARLFGGKTYLATQQYGPMKPFQTWLLKSWLRYLVSDYRVRNPACLKLLGQKETCRETWDEVFSNRMLFPIVERPSGKGSFILLNLRGGDLIDRGAYVKEDLVGFIEILKIVYHKTGFPYRFFAVSGAEFCEDEQTVEMLKNELAGAFSDNLGRIKDGKQLVALGHEAVACISMSFHGCILSGMAGIPFIPVTDGLYYDYKYIGFDKYGDGQQLPVIQLRGGNPQADAALLLNYVEHFNTDAAMDRRRQAARRLESYYDQIARDLL